MREQWHLGGLPVGFLTHVTIMVHNMTS